MTLRQVTIVVPEGYKSAGDFLKDCQFQLAPIATAEMLDAILSHINFDGIDSNGITIGELRRALPARSPPAGTQDREAMPDGATHMRRPEYITAWLFDRKSTMPIWLIEKYKSQPLPDNKIGHYATAIDGEFWRWVGPAEFDKLFVVALPPAPMPPSGATLPEVDMSPLRACKQASDARVSSVARVSLRSPPAPMPERQEK